MNAIPVNAVQSLIHGDIRSLPYHGQFHAMEILDGDLLVTMSIEDLTSAFNLIELGDPWMPFQALGKPVPGALAIPHRPEIAHLPWVYPASRVLMMGSKSACGIMQYIHRRILSMPIHSLALPKWEAGLRPHCQHVLGRLHRVRIEALG